MNRILILIFTLLVSVGAHAQTDLRKAYEAFSKTSISTQQSFTAKSKEDFSKALQENWKSFSLHEAESRRRKQVADSISRKKIELKKENVQIDISDVPVKSIVTKSKSSSTNAAAPVACAGMNKTGFDYFGVRCVVAVPSQYGTVHPASMTEKSVGKFWEHLSSADFRPFISDCRRFKSELKLNDWAMYEWISGLSCKVFPEDRNGERAIFTVFCLNQMGLRCKIARTDVDLLPIFASQQDIYGRRYVVIEGIKYYLAAENPAITRIESYDVDVREKLSSLDLNLAEHPIIGGKSDTVCNVRSSVLKGEMTIPVKTGVISFYDSYPQMDVNMYAVAATDRDFSEALLGKMRGLLNGRKGADAINLLLHFVQSDFGYRNDKEQFGREKPYFCEENFVYPFNDCEDRVVLFSYLVRNLLGYDMLLLDYEDHINCAVNICSEASGYYVRRGDSKYYVCDPTYVGASLGQSPKDYRVKPQSIWVI